MSSLVGLRVVRGPDWKWGDQDGGEGHVGTIAETLTSGCSQLGRRKVIVIWDSGFRGHYRAGPKGSYDLRIIDNPVGELHKNIFCGYPNCLAVIRGIRWKCADCELNLCTSCFFKEKPHNKDHSRYQRFDNCRVTNPPTVSSWNGDGPESRIKLMGIFPGAEVMRGSVWSSDSKELSHCRGVVLPAPQANKDGKILVNWIATNIRRPLQRCSVRKLEMCAKEAVVGGHYSPECLSIVDDGSVDNDQAIKSALDADIASWTIEKGSSIFLKAVEIGDLESAQFLFKKDKFVADAPNVDGKTVLQVACTMGRKEIVEWLINVVHVNLEERNRDGSRRAIHYAVLECEPEILSILIERGAALDEVMRGKKQSPLHIAIRSQFTECARLLIQHGCDVNLQDINGKTPLMTAYESNLGIIQFLVSSGRIDWKVKDKQGLNVLHLSVLKNDFKAIESILRNMDSDLALEPMPEMRNTVLHYASIHRNLEVAKLLLNHYVTVSDPFSLKRLLEAKNSSGMTACLIAVEEKDFALIELLKGAGANVNATDDKEDTALTHDETKVKVAPEEEISSSSEVNQSGRVKVAPEEESSSSSEVNQSGRVKEDGEELSVFWLNDGSKHGYCRDEYGNKYHYKRIRKDGSISFRCTEVVAGSAGGSGRCLALVYKLGEKIVLEKPHGHSLRKKEKKSSSPDGSEPPQTKRMRKTAGE